MRALSCRRSAGRLDGLAVALVFCAAASPAQAPPGMPSFGERVEVEVVDVDVVVTDRAGRPVHGLDRDLFEIRVDGETVPVAYFAPPPASVVEEPAPGSGATTESAGRGASHLAVFVDQAALSTRLRASALRELADFLDRRRGDELVTVAAFEERLHLLVPPTSDRAAVAAGLDALARLPTSGALAASERRHLDSRIRSLGIGWVGSDQSLAIAQREADLLELEVQRWAEEEMDRQHRALAALKQLVGALAALDGRKSLVLVSGGTSTEGAESLLTLLSRERLGPNQRPPLFDRKQRLREQFEDVIRVAQDARVALYAVHPPDATMFQGGADVGRIGQEPAALPRDPAIADAAASAAQLAGATGGRTYLLGSNLDARLGSVREDARAVYSLGFAADARMGSGDHRIEVRVHRPGVRVRHRSSFRRSTSAERADAALAAAATLAEVHDPLGLSIAIIGSRPVEGPAGDRLLTIELRLPLSALALVPEAGLRRGRLTTRVALLGARGELYTSAPVPVAIELSEAELDRRPGRVWTHRAEVRVASSCRRLALVVVDEVAGVHASAAFVTPGG